MKLLLSLVLMCMCVAAYAGDDPYDRLTSYQKDKVNKMIDELSPPPKPGDESEISKFVSSVSTAMEQGAKEANMPLPEFKDSKEGWLVFAYIVWTTFSQFVIRVIFGCIVFILGASITVRAFKNWTTKYVSNDAGDPIPVSTDPRSEDIFGTFVMLAITIIMTFVIMFG